MEIKPCFEVTGEAKPEEYKYQVIQVQRDGKWIKKFKCPKCGIWGDIDEDQFHGRVSILHEECGFHETIELCTKANKRE